MPWAAPGPAWQPGMAQWDWRSRPASANSAASSWACARVAASTPSRSARLIVRGALIDPVTDELNLRWREGGPAERHPGAAIAHGGEVAAAGAGGRARKGALGPLELPDDVAGGAVARLDPLHARRLTAGLADQRAERLARLHAHRRDQG